MECKEKFRCPHLLYAQLDLIETLWNVKNTTAEDHGWLVSRFNRDIVECKVIDTYQSTVDEIDLIETLWNVKWFVLMKP